MSILSYIVFGFGIAVLLVVAYTMRKEGRPQ